MGFLDEIFYPPLSSTENPVFSYGVYHLSKADACVWRNHE